MTPSSLSHAYLVKGWLLGRDVPADVAAAVDAIIAALSASPLPTVSGVVRGLTPTAVITVPQAANGPDMDRTTASAEGPHPGTSERDSADVTGTEYLTGPRDAEPDALTPRKPRAWSPEARAAAAERMRARQAAGLMKRRAAPDPERLPPADDPPNTFTEAELRITVPKPRRVSQLSDSDWPEVKRMLATGRSRAAVASDYDEQQEDLDHFIASCQRREAKAPGEAPAPLRAAAGAARPT